jgi:hypothetical protein
MHNQRALNFRRREAVARDVDHVCEKWGLASLLQ